VLKKPKDLKCLLIFIRLDLRARGRDFKLISILDPIIRFQIALRIYEYLIIKRSFLRFIFKVYFRSLSVKLSFSIPPLVFGPGLCIVHYGTIIVNPNSSIGARCRIHAGVNIGGKAGFFSEEEAKSLCPRIGKNCYIGPGAKIFGPISVGNHCFIGANAVVTKSFPDLCVIAGVPARVIRDAN